MGVKLLYCGALGAHVCNSIYLSTTERTEAMRKKVKEKGGGLGHELDWVLAQEKCRKIFKSFIKMKTTRLWKKI